MWNFVSHLVLFFARSAVFAEKQPPINLLASMLKTFARAHVGNIQATFALQNRKVYRKWNFSKIQGEINDIFLKRSACVRLGICMYICISLLCIAIAPQARQHICPRTLYSCSARASTDATVAQPPPRPPWFARSTIRPRLPLPAVSK